MVIISKKMLLLCLLLLTFSCSKDVIDNNFNERNGLIYKINSDKPFTGYRKSYYDNGQIQIDGEIEDGFWIWAKKYYRNGQLYFSHKYKEGKLHGKISSYFENGKLKHVETYKNGEMNGEAFYYDENGKIIQKSNYPNGYAIKYFSNGKERQRVKLKDSKVDGVAIMYNFDGTIWRKAEYKDGQYLRNIYESGRSRSLEPGESNCKDVDKAKRNFRDQCIASYEVMASLNGDNYDSRYNEVCYCAAKNFQVEGVADSECKYESNPRFFWKFVDRDDVSMKCKNF